MSNINSTLQLSNKALENFEVMKKSIIGIHEVLKLVLNEKDILYKVGMDNVRDNIEFYFDKPYTCESVIQELFVRGIIDYIESKKYQKK